jgi:hypothetical protein
MKCSQVRNELPDFVRARMEADEHRRISEHLSVCPDCAEEARGIRELFPVLDSGLWTPPDTYWATILPRVHRRLEQSSQPALPQWATRFALPLAAAIILAVGFFRLGPGAGEEFLPDFPSIVAQLPAEELQEVEDQETVAEILRPDLAATEPALAVSEDVENLKAILGEEGGATGDLDMEMVIGHEETDTPEAGVSAPLLPESDSLN